MGTVTAISEASVPAAADRVLEALVDYRTIRPAILTEDYQDYEVQDGGVGPGTVVTWRLQVAEDRIRHVVAEVAIEGDSVVERDQNSTMVTSFRVVADGEASQVTVTATWEGASGVGGFFERLFAPAALQRIHDDLLGNLAAHLAAGR